jgi:hypothetical protein
MISPWEVRRSTGNERGFDSSQNGTIRPLIYSSVHRYGVLCRLSRLVSDIGGNRTAISADQTGL